MSYFEIQKQRMLADGKTIRDAKVTSTERMIVSSFEDSPTYEEVFVNNSKYPLGARIVADTKNPAIKYIIMNPNDTLQAGDVIKRKNNSLWICTATDPNAVYTKGFIEECNIYLKWIDEFGLIQSQPSIFYFNTRSNFGVLEDKVMTVPDGRRQTTLQKNEHTIKIRRGNRFIIGGEAFKVIDCDSVSDKGLVNLGFESDQIDPAVDNIELGIANYFRDLAGYSISILNGEFASIGVNQTLQVNVQVKNNENIIKDALVTFSCSDNSIAEINESGLLSPFQTGSVMVTASFENIFANIYVTITQNKTSNYSVDIHGDDSIITGRTAMYRCQFKNNGIIYHDESIFHLISVDGSDTSLASIVEQNPIENTCIIKAGEKVGTIKLQVSNKNGLTVGSTLIQIKPLF